jgi:hypothetical protein
MAENKKLNAGQILKNSFDTVKGITSAIVSAPVKGVKFALQNPKQAMKNVITAPGKLAVMTGQEIARGAAAGTIQAGAAIKSGIAERVVPSIVSPLNIPRAVINEIRDGKSIKKKIADFNDIRTKATREYNDRIFGAGVQTALKSVQQGVLGGPVPESQLGQAGTIGLAASNFVGGKVATTAIKEAQLARQVAQAEARRQAAELNKTSVKKVIQATTGAANKAADFASRLSVKASQTSALGATMGVAQGLSEERDLDEVIQMGIGGAYIGALISPLMKSGLGNDGNLSPAMIKQMNKQAEAIRFLPADLKNAYNKAVKNAENTAKKVEEAKAAQKIASRGLSDATAKKKYKALTSETQRITKELDELKDVTDDVSLATRTAKEQRLREIAAEQKQLKPQVAKTRAQDRRLKQELDTRKNEESLDLEIKQYAKKSGLKQSAIRKSLKEGKLKGKETASLRKAYNSVTAKTSKLKEANIKATAEEKAVTKAANRVASLDIRAANIKADIAATADAAKKKVLEKELKSVRKKLNEYMKEAKAFKNFKKSEFTLKRREERLKMREAEADSTASELAGRLGLTIDQFKNGLKNPLANKELTPEQAPFWINTKEGVAIPKATFDAAVNAPNVWIPGYLSLRRAVKYMDFDEPFGILYKTVYQPIAESFKKREDLTKLFKDEIEEIAPKLVSNDSSFAPKMMGVPMFRGKNNMVAPSSRGGSLLSKMVQMRGMKLEADNRQWNMLSKADQKIVDDMVEKYNKFYANRLKEINDELVSVGQNKIILKRENYFPVFANDDLLSQIMIKANAKMLSGAKTPANYDKMVDDFYFEGPAADIKANFRKKRMSEKVPVFDAYSGAMRYAPQAARIIAQTKTLQYIRALTAPNTGAFSGGNKKLLDKLSNDISGLPGWTQKVINTVGKNVVAPVARGVVRGAGKAIGSERMQAMESLVKDDVAYRFIRGYNTFNSAMQLGLSVKNAILQTSQVAFSVGNYGVGRVIASTMPATDDIAEMWSKSNTATLRISRNADLDTSKYSNIPFFLTSQADNWSVRVTWRTAAQSALDSGATKEAAIAYADDIVDNVMAPTIQGLASRVATNPLVRLALPFRSFLINQQQMFGEGFRSWSKSKTGAQAIRIGIGTFFATQMTNALFEEANMNPPFPLDVSSFIFFYQNPRYNTTEISEPLNMLLGLDFDGIRGWLEKRATPSAIRDWEAALDILEGEPITVMGSKAEFESERTVKEALKSILSGVYSTKGGQEYINELSKDPSAWEQLQETVMDVINPDRPKDERKETYQYYYKAFQNQDGLPEREAYELAKKIEEIEVTNPEEAEIAKQAYIDTLPEPEDIVEMYEKLNRDELSYEEAIEMVEAVEEIEQLAPDKLKEIEKLIEEIEEEAYVPPLTF